MSNDEIDIGVDWIDSDSFAFQIDGNDLVHVSDIGEDGTATITVFASTHPNAVPVYATTVNVYAHKSKKRRN